MSGMHIVETLFIVLIAISLVQLLISWLVYGRLAFYSKEAGKNISPVSVIICARNESIQLRQNLPSILEQNHSAYEVIVVNDCSWDETGEYLTELSARYSHLKVVTIKEQEKYRTAKKFALSLGIKAASNEILVFTDADCKPASSDWLSLMQSSYKEGSEFVLGYGPYKRQGGLLNKLIRYDTFVTAIQYLSAAIGGNPYMGVGRNLSYKKSVFFRSKGFARHNHILSGDDDLFVNENATAKNTAVVIEPSTFTYSEPKKNFSGWLKQKARHLSTSRYYKPAQKLSLLVKNLSILIFYLALIALILLNYDATILLSLYLVFILGRLPIVYKIGRKLKENDLIWAYPVLEIIHTFLQPVFYTANLLTNQKKWK